jgi:hypothetical protein
MTQNKIWYTELWARVAVGFLLWFLFSEPLSFSADSSRPTRTKSDGDSASPSAPKSSQTERDYNPVFGYSHLAGSPYTLPSGRLVYGTDVAVGVTNQFQVGTNILRDSFQFYNAQAKYRVVSTSSFAAATTFGFETFDTAAVGVSTQSAQITNYLPGVVTAVGVGESVAWFNSGSINLSKATVPSDMQKAGYIRGSQAESDIAWAYNQGTTKRGDPFVRNALAAGVSYDFTYKVLGYGMSHHWHGFQLGAHYYPEAKRQKLQPIIAGGGTMQF